MELDEVLDRARAYMTVVVSNRKNQNPNGLDEEDIIQEGVIRVWQEFTEGNRNMPHMLRTAALTVNNYLGGEGSNTAMATGKPKMAQDFRSTVAGELTRQRVRDHRDAWFREHGVYPTGTQTAKDLGISRSSVNRQIQNISSGAIVPIKERNAHGRGVYLKLTEPLMDTQEDGTEVERKGIGAEPSAEAEYLHSLSGIELIQDCPQRDKEILFLRFWEDLSYKQIGLHFGAGGRRPDNQGRIMVNRAIKRIKEKHEG